MDLIFNIMMMSLLIISAGFLSLTEIAFTGERTVKLQILANIDEQQIQKSLNLQQQSTISLSIHNTSIMNR